MDRFACGIVQLLHQRIELMGRFTFGCVLKWTGTVSDARQPPFIRLRIKSMIPAPPIGINMMRDAMDPGRKSRAPFVRADRIPYLAKRFLCQVPGVRIIARKPPDIGEYPFVMQREQLGCGFAIAVLRQPPELFDALAHNVYLISRAPEPKWTKENS